MSGTSTHTDRTVLGIGLAFLSFAILAVADAMTKLLSGGYSIFEVAVIDSIVAMAVCLPVLVYQDGLASLRPRHMGIVALRGAVGAASLITAFLSFSMIPLADAYSLAFIAPLVVTALSVPILREHVSWRQWIAVIVGLVAVIVILRPNFGMGLGQLYILISAILFAISMLMLRRIAKTEPNGGLVLLYFVMVILISLPVAVPHWVTPNGHDLAIMVLTGISSGLGNLLLIFAFRYAAATIVSSFMYSELIWGVIFGLVLFGDLPDLITILGAVVLIGCGIYTLTHAAAADRALPA
ncbi:MAG TPA: DMT family transporter [Magnetospirillaceae bacterium]|jgi:drug/metabolite transporter (DMT)-like permease